jgi:Tfp pilus assembly protein PilX
MRILESAGIVHGVPNRKRPFARNRGAVLVICLILLAALTLLAGSALQSSASDLAQSAADEFRARAQSAADTALVLAEQSLLADPPPASRDIPQTTLQADAGTLYAARLRFIADDPATAAASAGARTARHYTLEGTGFAPRRATVRVAEGVLLFQDTASGDLSVQRLWWQRLDVE